MGHPESNLRVPHPHSPQRRSRHRQEPDPPDPSLQDPALSGEVPPADGFPLEKDGLPSRCDRETLRARAATIDARCPYCHDGIELLEEAWSCCALCLGRHHRECWREHGACAACGNERSLSTVPGREASIWRAPRSFRERLMSVGAGLLIAIPLLIPAVVLGGKLYDQGGLIRMDTLAALDASLPVAESARESYRNYLISRNSGYETTARVQLELAEAKLAAAVSQLEAALAGHRQPDGTLPRGLASYQTVLERLIFYHGNTQRALESIRRDERAEREAKERQVGIPPEPRSRELRSRELRSKVRFREVAGG